MQRLLHYYLRFLLTRKMKIKILLKNITDEELNVIKQGTERITSLLPIDFTFETTTANFTSIPFKNLVAEGYLLNNKEILPLVSGQDDIACLLYDWTTVSPQPTNPATFPDTKGNTITIAIPKQWWNNYVDVFVQFFLHELCHAMYYKKGGKDITHDFYASSFAQKQPTDYYLWLLKDLIKPVQPLLLRKGSKGEDVRILQKNLKALGYFKYGMVTTTFGMITESAVKAFQSNNGLKADGIVGAITLSKIDEALKKNCPLL